MTLCSVLGRRGNEPAGAAHGTEVRAARQSPAYVRPGYTRAIARLRAGVPEVEGLWMLTRPGFARLGPLVAVTGPAAGAAALLACKN